MAGSPGALWEAPQIKKGDTLKSSDLQSMFDQVQRLSRIPNVPGLSTSWGFFPDQATGGGTGGAVQFVLLDDALLPGTYDLPGVAKGKLMSEAGNDRLAVSATEVTVVNYSTSIYAPIGGLAIVQAFGSGKLVAVGSAS